MPVATPLRNRLLKLVLVAFAPAIVLSSAALLYVTERQTAAIEQSTTATLGALLNTVDTELTRSLGIAEALAASPRLRAGDLRGFYDESRIVLDLQPSWTNIVLFSAQGSLLLNTNVPWGQTLARDVLDKASFDAVMATGKPVVGNAFIGRTNKVPVFAIRVPVFKDGKVAYVLSPTLKADSILAVLAKHRALGDATVTVIDSGGSILARSQRHAEYVGKTPSPGFWKVIQASDQGWMPSTTLDGLSVHTAFLRSAWSGWRMVYSVPDQFLYAGVWRTVLIMGAGMLLSILLGFAVTMAMANRIAAPVAQLRRAAEAIGSGEKADLPLSDVEEVNTLAQALREAAAHRDQTELVLQDALKQAEKRRLHAETANRAKDKLLAMLGHELRNPLAPMANCLEMLRLGGSKPEQLEKIRQMMARQLTRMTRLVDDLLDISRVTRGVIQLQKQSLLLQTVMDDLRETCWPMLEEKGHQFTVGMPEERVTVHCDPFRLTQALCNLVGNAAKYTPQGGRVEVDCVVSGGMLEVRVRDNGTGLRPEELPHLFDLFFQGENATDQGGLGLGLALVREIISLHGGTIAASSDGPGRGSEFRVRLPLRADDEASLTGREAVSA